MNRAYIVSDSLTMLWRLFTHMLRNPVAVLMSTLATPIILLVMMYNLFGGLVESSATTDASGSYINYLTPGLILITAIYGMAMAGVRANSDMTQGIINRFRTMSVARVSVLNGHVISSTLGSLFSILVIIGLAVATGFRPTTHVASLVAAFGLVLLLAYSVTWLAVAAGVASKSPEALNGLLYLMFILPFLSTAFVPSSTMTPVLAWIAENQPFSPIIDTLRGLLLDTPVGSRGLVAVGWCVGFALVGYVWARVAYSRSVPH